MNKITIITIMALFLAAISAVSALPVNLEEVQIDNTILQENAVNKLSLERGTDYEVRVKFTPTANIKDAEVRAFISGYEYSDVSDIADKSQLFDADSGVTYVKKLNIMIPEDVDSAEYKLRIIISDRYSDERVADYNLKLDVPRNALKIEDVVFNPSGAVKAGSALLATVRVQNSGEKDQTDVKVTVSIPALGISATNYIADIKNNDKQEETEEMFLRIPKCSKAGNYDATVDVEYSQGHYKISEKKEMAVLADDTCNEAEPKTTITLGNQMQSATAGQTATFPVTVTNAGKTSKTFIVTVPSADWATITITPTSTLVVPAGQTQTIFVNAQLSEDVPAGAHSLTATVSSGEQTQELTLTTNVLQSKSTARSVFETILIVLVVLLVILGIVLGIAHLRNKEQAETYY
ncbi:NPCBM-associated, NEW3 domain of alpha-galactosidase [uncultured archaeon]|nr:NPCBM-associated, NEW3 domain of alpha-galactosidase [uncultured archaeon]